MGDYSARTKKVKGCAYHVGTSQKTISEICSITYHMGSPSVY